MARPKTPKLTIDAIVDAAIDLAGSTGDFTVGQLAARLGVTQSSLYNHVPGKDGVVALIRQRMHEEMAVRVDTGGAWQDTVRLFARAQRDQLAKHPWLIQLLATSPAEPGGAVSSVENLATVLVRAGFAYQDVMPIIASIDIVVIGASIDLLAPELLYPRSVVEGSDVLARALLATPRHAPRAEVAFAFTLDLLVEALESRLAAPP